MAREKNGNVLTLVLIVQYLTVTLQTPQYPFKYTQKLMLKHTINHISKRTCTKLQFSCIKESERAIKVQ